MGRVNTPILDKESQSLLEGLYKGSGNHGLRTRCQVILLKAQGRTSKDVGQIVGMSHVSVNSWLKRYNAGGIAGLSIKEGRGRKPIMDPQEDAQLVSEAVKKHRQSVTDAKAEWEGATGKQSSKATFKRFLKSLAEGTGA